MIKLKIQSSNLFLALLLLHVVGCSYFSEADKTQQKKSQLHMPLEHSVLKRLKDVIPVEDTSNQTPDVLADAGMADMVRPGEGGIDTLALKTAIQLQKDNAVGVRNNYGALRDELKMEREQLTALKSKLSFETIFPSLKADERVTVKFNGDSMNLRDIVPMFQAALGNFNYEFNQNVTGTVSLSINAEMTYEDVWTLFLQLLYQGKAYCDYYNNVLYINQLNDIQKDFNRADSNILVYRVPIVNMASSTMMGHLKTFVNSDSTIMEMPTFNSIILIDTPDNVLRMREIINLLDKREKANWERLVLPCNFIKATKLLSELKSVMGVMGYDVESKTDGASTPPGAIHMIVNDRLGFMIASSSSKAALDELKYWASQLDQVDMDESVSIFSYQVQNSRADRLLRNLASCFNIRGRILNTTGGEQDITGIGYSTEAKEAENVVNEPDSPFTKPVFCMADLQYNRLLLRATPRTYSYIKAVLGRLDKIPPQVLLQVTVVEVELTNSDKFGMEWSLEPTINGQKVNMGTQYPNLIPGDVSSTGEVGGKMYLYDPNNKNQYLYIKALAGRDKVKVVSCPQVMIISDSQAKVSVGRDVPLVVNELTDTESSGETNTSFKRSYKYQNTGVILTVTPHISAGGLVELELEQEISDATSGVSLGVSSPIVKNDKIKTNLSLRSGRTIMIGGLIRQKDDSSTSSIPMIADIPFLNTLTGDSSSEVTNTEVLMLVTATIVDQSVNLEKMIDGYNTAISDLRMFEQKLYEEKIAREKMEEQGYFDQSQGFTQENLNPDFAPMNSSQKGTEKTPASETSPFNENSAPTLTEDAPLSNETAVPETEDGGVEI